MNATKLRGKTDVDLDQIDRQDKCSVVVLSDQPIPL